MYRSIKLICLLIKLHNKNCITKIEKMNLSLSLYCLKINKGKLELIKLAKWNMSIEI